MRCKTLGEFKKGLQEIMNSQDIEGLKSLTRYNCPFPLFRCDYNKLDLHCPNCPLSDKKGPGELIGPMKIAVVCREYACDSINKDTALARLILEGTKLLAYLESREIC